VTRERLCRAVCHVWGIRVIAEEIETRGARDFFPADGVTLMQV
jgi:EAL domain-containing protein (putative c-di-GMP-specific phosphodiesterase class I)